MKILDKALAKIALISAKSGAGMASMWNAYQPKEPDMKKLNK